MRGGANKKPRGYRTIRGACQNPLRSPDQRAIFRYVSRPGVKGQAQIVRVDGHVACVKPALVYRPIRAES